MKIWIPKYGVHDTHSKIRTASLGQDYIVLLKKVLASSAIMKGKTTDSLKPSLTKRPTEATY